MKFKVGDRVKYTSGKHGDSQIDPLWGVNKIVGTVERFIADSRWPIHVTWDNHHNNTYNEKDLELITPTKKKDYNIYCLEQSKK